MKKIKALASALSLTLLLVYVVPIQSASANTAGIFVSPSSSSVALGDTIAVQVRINSSVNAFNAAEARLNFDSSKLQFISHGNGALTPVVTTTSSNSFYYAGASLGTSLSGNQLLFSVTFKAVDIGTASLSISDAAAFNGTPALSISSSGGSINIRPPASSAPSGGSRRPAASQPANEADQPPALSRDPTIAAHQATIALSLNCNKDCRVQITYKSAGSEPQTAHSDDLKTGHDFILGRDAPLVPGTEYELSIVLRSDQNVASQPIVFKTRTKGITFQARLVDQSGRPLANHPVTLHSDPIDAVTDGNGVAKFEDVTPGEHTLVFDIDGITVRQPVSVGNPLLLANGGDKPQDVVLPFRLSDENGRTNQDAWTIGLFAAIGGGAVGQVMARSKYTRAAARRVHRRIKNPNRIRPALKRAGGKVKSKLRRNRTGQQAVHHQDIQHHDTQQRT